ncbi:MAG: hypothetical protein AAB518_04395, partial [Patescibacteria group bacterium]
MVNGKKIFVAIEMVGTLNALNGALGVLEKEGVAVVYAAEGEARKKLVNQGISCFGVEEDAEEILKREKPDLVIVGITSGMKQPGGSGLEKNYALRALDRGIPVVAYRDYVGVHTWFDEVAKHPRSTESLHFFLFGESDVQLIRRLGLPSREAIAVGSGYYDDDTTRSWGEVRRSAREAMGFQEKDFVIISSPGAERERVFEMLRGVVEGIHQIEQRVIFISTHHPKDPDAPFETPTSGKLSVKKSSVYDVVVDRLKSTPHRIVCEPEFRNAVPDPKHRIATADVLDMNPLSTELNTAVYAGVPVLPSALPLTIQAAEARRVVIK